MAVIRIWNPHTRRAGRSHRAESGRGQSYAQEEGINLKRKTHRRRRHRNPLGVGRDEIMLALSGVGGGIGALALPAIVLPSSNNGAMGYAMNLAAAFGLKIVGDMVSKNVGDGAFVGGLVATGLRIAKDNFGSSIPGLGAYWPSYFPVPTVSNPYGQTLASPYPAPMIAAPAKQGMSGSARFRARQ